jgi:hypothetical protein
MGQHIHTRGHMHGGTFTGDACTGINTWGCTVGDTHEDTCTEETQGKYAWGDIHMGGYIQYA